MEMKDLKALSVKDLNKELAHAREQLRRFRFDLAQGKLTEVRKIRDTRKTIARILTLTKQ